MTTLDRIFLRSEGLVQGPFSSENHAAVSKLYEYKRLYLPDPDKTWDLFESQRRSYEIWAVDELIWRSVSNPDSSFLDILDQFANELEDARTKQGSCTEIFEAAVDVIEEVRYWICWELA